MNELVKKIEEANEAYYNGESTMTDAEFDALLDRLREIDPNHSLLKKVGAKITNSVWPKVEHKIPMGSQIKVNTKEELEKWMASIDESVLFFSEKMDGISIELIYDDGILVQAITRGDGFIGEDITPNVKMMDVPQTIKQKGRLAVRGEIILPLSVWAEHFPNDKNSRNTGAGIARRKHNNSDCSLLSVYAFDILDLRNVFKFDTKWEKFSLLLDLGFKTPKFLVTDSPEIIMDSYRNTFRELVDYEIDGIIFAVNNLEKAEKLGFVDNRPKSERAYKFESKTATSKLLEVTWQVGRTGVITPVAEIEPVDVGGITVSRVTIDNYDQVKVLGLKLGSSLTIKRANDVIPDIVTSTGGDKDIELPKSCPACSADTTFDGVKLWCTNDNCPAVIIKRLEHFLDVIDVKGMGEKILVGLVDLGIVKHIPDLYDITPDDIAKIQGQGVKLGKKVVDQIQSRRSLDVVTFFKALGIKGVSRTFTEVIVEEVKPKSIDDLRSLTEDSLIKINRIGDHVAHCFVNGLIDNKELIDTLMQKVEVIFEQPAVQVAIDGPLTGKSFCFTGFRSKELEEIIVHKGGTILSGVSKKLTHLVCKDPDSASSKVKKAKDLGVKVISVEELKDLTK